MIKLNPPYINSELVYTKCLEDYDDIVVKTQLLRLENEINTSTHDYIEKACNERLFEVDQQKTFYGENLKNALTRLYKDYMVKEGSKGRIYYDQIKSSYFKCSVCNHQIPSTLDHFLPKSKYPLFSVNPINLVPCCNDCNNAKSTFSASNYTEQLIHPYFDKDIFFQVKWLRAKVLENNPIGIVFEVIPEEEWTEDINLLRRIQTHFNKYKLNLMYSPQAITEIYSLKRTLHNRYLAQGSTAVISFLSEVADSKEDYHCNSWQAATYRTLSENEWFCSHWVSSIT